MISESSSVRNILDRIISEIEAERRQENRISKNTLKRKLDEVLVINKRRKLSTHEFPDGEEIQCRICYDPTQQLPIIYPCKCKGTIGAVHLKCLEHWLEESNRSSCELCGQHFQVERTPRYRVLQSIVVWLLLDQQEHQLYVRSVRADLLRCLIVTPITIACSYICIVAADFYAMNNYDNFPPAKWTTYSLLAMMSLLIFSYFIWMYMAMQYHQKVWFYWWQKTSRVKIILHPENTVLIKYKSNVTQV